MRMVDSSICSHGMGEDNDDEDGAIGTVSEEKVCDPSVAGGICANSSKGDSIEKFSPVELSDSREDSANPLVICSCSSSCGSEGDVMIVSSDWLPFQSWMSDATWVTDSSSRTVADGAIPD
jgi:hypothetical protein